MNWSFAREVGYTRYIRRRILWRIAKARGAEAGAIMLPTGVSFRLPWNSYFASDVYVTEGNVDLGSEYIAAKYLAERCPGAVLFDVGANIGYYSVLLAPMAANVFAFEPDERNLPALQKAVEASPHVKIVTEAVADVDGEMSFVSGEVSEISHLAVAENDGGHRISVCRLDSFAVERGLEPALIKVDVEGFDILVVEGAAELMQQCRPVFLIEFNIAPGRPNSHERLAVLLDRFDYQVFAMTRKDVSAFSCEITFRQLSGREVESANARMLFLAPRENTWFPLAVEAVGTWRHTDLRPGAMKRFLQKPIAPARRASEGGNQLQATPAD